MSLKSSFDASIPVLTEVFQEPPAAVAPAQDEPEWALLERRVSERILQQLPGQFDSVLEQRLRESMEAALQQAMAGLTDEIRRSLQHTIEQVVAVAVAQELAHLRAINNGA